MDFNLEHMIRTIQAEHSGDNRGPLNAAHGIMIPRGNGLLMKLLLRQAVLYIEAIVGILSEEPA